MTYLNHIDLPGERCRCSGHPTECWDHPVGCGCVANGQTPSTVDKSGSHSQTVDNEATKDFEPPTKGCEPKTNTFCNQKLDPLSPDAKLSPEANSDVLYGDPAQIAREETIAIAYFETTHFQFWHQATPEEKEEALHVARAIIAADSVKDQRAEVARLRKALEDVRGYAGWGGYQIVDEALAQQGRR